ncbi:hypothetical protein [Marinomonas sp. GJ51-6]|uniref:hypothetical protein n=1 Tax=Marinomonas sp. GJ51-6 TaxID=2992802 RepID=UPI0029348751|nr:hypothetical protein [Marinomonas sp. GJ51-6]WOD06202.1 hypothetical protein ONZ50_10685 [Marinomonas sp. GJ51-6]
MHLGPHNTGSTSFQNVLEKNEVLLKDKNIALMTVRSNFSDTYKELRNGYTKILQGALLSDEIEERKVRDELASVLVLMVEAVKKQQPNARKILISDENLLGPPPGHYFANRKGREKSFYSLHKLIFESIKLAFTSDLEKVIFSNRDCEELVLSSYNDFVSKLTDAESLSFFKESLSLEIYKQYDVFFKSADLVFGEKLKLYNFDLFCNDFVGVTNELLDVTVEEPLSSDFGFSKTISPKGIQIALKVIPFLSGAEEINQFRKFLFSVS